MISPRATLAHSEVRELVTHNNPHFIYNVLTTIAMFVRTDPTRAQELLIDFAEFTRYSSGAPGNFIMLGEELRNIDRYLTLEQARFGARLQVRQQIAAALLPVRLPFLTLQQLVEGAVRHGMDTYERGSTVVISVADAGTKCLITVEESEITRGGMDCAASRGSVETRWPAAEIRYIGDRLRAAYRDDYDLVVNITPDVGTTVSLRVPKSAQDTP